jgi:hypothetical protein
MRTVLLAAHRGQLRGQSNHAIKGSAGVTLALTSYEGVAWTVEVVPDASVSRIIVLWYKSQERYWGKFTELCRTAFTERG